MADIVEIADMLGTVQLQEDDCTEDLFNEIRDEWQDTYIYKLLGAELGKLFLADLDANSPTTLSPRFQAIYDKFVVDVEECFSFSYYGYSVYSGKIVQSKGIKDYIKYVIWFYFARNNNVIISLAGNKLSVGENSEPSADGFNLVRNYNKAIDTGRAIQWYVCNNEDGHEYPEYNGTVLDYAIPNG